MAKPTNDQIQTAVEEILAMVRAEVGEMVRVDWRDGADHYRAVRVAPNGSVRAVREPSRSVSEGEYRNRVPHDLTVWEESRSCPPAGPENGIFAWVDDLEGPYVGDPDTGDFETIERAEERGEGPPEGWRRFSLDPDEVVGDLLGEDNFREREIRDAIRAWIEAGNLDTEFFA